MGIYGRLDAAARRDLLKEVSLDKQYYKEHVQNILYDNYVKLALVNIDTGEYVSVISVDKNADNYKSTSDVSSYLRITRDWTAVILMKSENLNICVI